MNKEDLISIGQVLKPHGIHGFLKVLNLSSFPERFKILRRVILSFGNILKEFDVEETRFHKKFILFKIKGIDNLEEAEKWRGAEIMVKAEEIWKKSDNLYYYFELMELPCYLQNGEFLGNVSGIEEVGEKINLIIKEENGYENSVPFVKEFIEVERGVKIIVKPIPNLLSKKKK